eukprot:CAMPEP_0178981498 /NCGR_PEP_ID=MMETSP0789-20121207/27089_1 /TAXON_ID=3005 /ORGANISM="Rhizosolenia setigera, Strain CCMP 1694" /LENGTH=283 /DNA_ID=CAMNT_0020672037 /DNA_START=566 /DNA_END=1414 /DNA_ORIENTATION=+
MKLSSLALLLFSIRASTSVLAFTDCDPTTEIDISSDILKLTVDDYDVEAVNRFSSKVRGNKIVLKGYKSKPVVKMNNGAIAISGGELCGKKSSETASEPTDTTDIELPEETEEPSAELVASVAASISPLVMANYGLISPLTGIAVTMLMGIPFTSAESTGTGSITIDIYTDTDALVHNTVSSMTCPPESFYFEHHPSVYGGYSGCVGEKYLLPCAQDAQGASDSSLYEKYPINWNGSECVETGYTFEDRTFWILWGDPLDKNELLKRTGILPTVYLPLERGPY